MTNTQDTKILGLTPNEIARATGIESDGSSCKVDRKQIIRFLAFKLSTVTEQEITLPDDLDDNVLHIQSTMGLLQGAEDLMKHFRQMKRLLRLNATHLCPVDTRIQCFLDQALGGFGLNDPCRLPSDTFILDRVGLATEMSIPVGRTEYKTAEIESFKLVNGILHNNKNDKRTTKGSFHVAEYGLPIAADKISVPLRVFGNILAAALKPPDDLMVVPFTALLPTPVKSWCSLLIRPLVCPAVANILPEKRAEIRYFAPAGLVACLDFVERIFGNWGDPYLYEHDAALDPGSWSGTTGCVIVAPWITTLKKIELGLPKAADATERQKRDGMYYENPDELYNEGRPFKITCRNASGVMVTLLGDSYFGYCKKEVKTQMSFSANLLGLAEEEHAGGALSFPAYNIQGGVFRGVDATNNPHLTRERSFRQWVMKDYLSLAQQNLDTKGFPKYTFAHVMEEYASIMDVHSEGYATDKRFPDIIYVPEDVQISLAEQKVCWTSNGKTQSIKLLPGFRYVHPTGYTVRMEKNERTGKWRLIGVSGVCTFCHKPCTVSGGGKSEISKSIGDQIAGGPIYVEDMEKDLDFVQKIIEYDFSTRWKVAKEEDKSKGDKSKRSLMSDERSLGSTIKMLTPSSEYNEEYNAWITSIPHRIRTILLLVKRLYSEEESHSWRKDFSVDIINGQPGHALKRAGNRLSTMVMRLGLSKHGHQWISYKLRPDFARSEKVQMEDDITASVTVPREWLPGARPNPLHPSLKVAQNGEWRLFQRPDDAVIPGFDKQAESDLGEERGCWLSNFQPLVKQDVREIREDVGFFDEFSLPMRTHMEKFDLADESEGFLVCSAKKRILQDSTESTNPRYLQVRSDVSNIMSRYLAEIQVRFHRMLPLDQPVIFPVNTVISGRRNNVSDPAHGIPPLCCYGPIHYQRPAEFFMDVITSVTGKSPSTTGFGSEGALTKGPFNALRFSADLNAAFVSHILTNYHGLSSSAGFVGPNYRVDHDISLLIPEIWCRLTAEERDADTMVRDGLFEKLTDFEYKGEKVLASRLGYRITSKFTHQFFGRIFDNPSSVFPEELLKPELQDMDMFVDGVSNIVKSQRIVAQNYFDDGSIDDAIPPIQAILHVMVHGHYKGKDLEDPEIQNMFTREYVLSSDWYRERLRTKQKIDVRLWKRGISYLQSMLKKYGDASAGNSEVALCEKLNIRDRLEKARAELDRCCAPAYLEMLKGTCGADPSIYFPDQEYSEHLAKLMQATACPTPAERKSQ